VRVLKRDHPKIAKALARGESALLAFLNNAGSAKQEILGRNLAAPEKEGASLDAFSSSASLRSFSFFSR
jgi:hypothetical protein